MAAPLGTASLLPIVPPLNAASHIDRRTLYAAPGIGRDRVLDAAGIGHGGSLDATGIDGGPFDAALCRRKTS